MIVFKIFQILLLLVVISVLISVTWRFIKDMRVHNKRMKKLDQWSAFHSQLMDWSKEIQDVNVRVNFINQCVHKLIQKGNDGLSNNSLDDWDVEEERRKICSEWGQHIPSLLQEIREKKLNSLV